MPRDGSFIFSNLPGTEGVPDTTIESAKYNAYIGDIELDLNTPRPIVAGGTGATNARDAMINLKGEIAYQVVTNFDDHQWTSGSFWADTGASNSPVAGHTFAGFAITYPPVTPPTAPDHTIVQARDLDDTSVPGREYIRERTGGVWGPWASATAELENTKVDRAGDTMTGDLTIEKDFPELILNSTTGTHAVISYRDQGIIHWQWGEADLSNHFFVDRHDAAGVFQETSFVVRYDTGGAEFHNSIAVGKGVANGAVHFGPFTNNTFLYRNSADGNYYFIGGGLVVDSALGLDIRNGPAHVAGAFSVNGFTTLGTNVRIVNGGNATQGIAYFGNTGGSTFIYMDGQGFEFSSDHPAGAYLKLNNYNYTIGGSTVATGIYTDGGSVIFRAYGNNSLFMQNANGTITYAQFGNGASTIHGSLTVNNGLGVTGAIGATGIISTSAAGNVLYAPNGAVNVGQYVWTLDKGYQPGGGVWSDTSDERTKNVLGNYASGLAQVLALQPVRFTFKGNDGITDLTPEGEPLRPHAKAAEAGTEYIGLVAQQAEVPMPEMVTKRRGFIDGVLVTDVRELNTTPLIFALVNSVKELAARVAALEAS